MITKKNYQLHEKDTGSTAVQIISLREKIEKEKTHLGKNKKDIPAGRALKKKIAKEKKKKKKKKKNKTTEKTLKKKIDKEKKFFRYIKKHNPDAYDKLKKELSL